MAHENTDGSAVQTFFCHQRCCAERGLEPGHGLVGADTCWFPLLSQLVPHLGAGRCSSRQPASSSPPAAIVGGLQLLEGVTALSAPEYPLPPLPPSSFLSPLAPYTWVHVTCSSDPDAAPWRTGPGDCVLTSLPESWEVGPVGDAGGALDIPCAGLQAPDSCAR